MPVRSSFTAGEVLTAADLTDTFASKVDYALTANAQSGTGASAYTFVLADASRLTTATGTSAKTFTIPPQANVAWVANSIIRVANYGTGDLTIAGGSGVTVTNATKTLAQFESAALVRTGSNAWTLIPFSGGAGNADFSDAADGTYTDGGVTWKWKRYTASGTLTVTRAGFADVLVVGGGAGGARPGGGAGGHLYITDAYLPSGTLTVTVGAGGAGGNGGTQAAAGDASRLGSYFAPGGGPAGGNTGTNRDGYNGGSGGGGNFGYVGGSGISGLGNNGGSGSAVGFPNDSDGGGGGGGGAGAQGAAGGIGGAGGAGIANSITGSSVTRAGGGGGGGRNGGGAAGSGGGGAGVGTSGTPGNGTANTGGGGGGDFSQDPSGNGGSGVVIIRVRT